MPWRKLSYLRVDAESAARNPICQTLDGFWAKAPSGAVSAPTPRPSKKFRRVAMRPCSSDETSGNYTDWDERVLRATIAGRPVSPREHHHVRLRQPQYWKDQGCGTIDVPVHAIYRTTDLRMGARHQRVSEKQDNELEVSPTRSFSSAASSRIQRADFVRLAPSALILRGAQLLD